MYVEDDDDGDVEVELEEEDCCKQSEEEGRMTESIDFVFNGRERARDWGMRNGKTELRKKEKRQKGKEWKVI